MFSEDLGFSSYDHSCFVLLCFLSFVDMEDLHCQFLSLDFLDLDGYDGKEDQAFQYSLINKIFTYKP